MREIGYYLIFIIIIAILIPLLIIKGCGGFKKDYTDGLKDNRIKVYFHLTKKVEKIDFEEYIKGVVAAEMPASYHVEALKAQAVAARTYAYKKAVSGGSNLPEHKGADICTDSAHCQAWISKEEVLAKWPASKARDYWDRISWAVKSTAGKMVYYENEIANPVFHANSGGETENSEDAWNGVAVPYLRAVKSPGEEGSSGYFSEVEFSAEEFVQRLNKFSADFKVDSQKVFQSIKIVSYTGGGRVKNINIGNKTFSGTDIRSIFNLKSTNFLIEDKKGKILFKVKGFGHGVGLSQCGADALAQKGCNYKDILGYYYKGVQIKE
ncbi:MAG: stage II sporulation protein D [Deltaproteobacteria bacterium]